MTINLLPCREYLYRDYLALTLGGETEVAVLDGFIDVLTKTSVIETKYARSESVKNIASTLEYYWRCIEDKYPQEQPRKKEIHYIWSINRLHRNEEQRKAQQQFVILNLPEQGYILTGTVERDIQPEYCIGGLKFETKSQIADHIRQITEDFLSADYLTEGHRQFLTELSDAYTWLKYKKHTSKIEVSSTDFHGEGMVVSVHDRHIPIFECIPAFQKMTHYRLLSAPDALKK